MRINLVLILLTLAFATINPQLSNAGAPQTDPSIETFWARFKLAVTKGDKEGVANLSEFPTGMPYGFRKIKTRAELLRRYREVFNVQVNAVKCFADARPSVDATAKNQCTVGCKDKAGNETVVYGFVKIRGNWKFKYLDNINE
jgi:hypothetical protein